MDRILIDVQTLANVEMQDVLQWPIPEARREWSSQSFFHKIQICANYID